MRKILILGHAEHGKSKVAELLEDFHGFTFKDSSYFAAETFLAEKLGYDSVDDCFNDRRNRRTLWHDEICEFNTPHKDRLAKMMLQVADVYVGMRCPDEFLTCMGYDLDTYYKVKKPIFDIVIWVNASKRKPLESKESMKISKIEAQVHCYKFIEIDNNGTLDELINQVRELKL
jgi:hypothetical protein